MGDINTKNSPNQMRILINRIREGNYIDESNEIVPNYSMRDMLKITRKLNESDNNDSDIDLAIPVEEKALRNEFLNVFDKSMKVSVKLRNKIELTKDMGYWGGTINGVIQFVYIATNDEDTSGVKFNYLDGFSPDNPENDEIIKKVESFYNRFYNYWEDEISKINT